MNPRAAPTFMPLWNSFPTDVMQPSGFCSSDSHLRASSMCLSSTKMYGRAPPKDFITKAVSLKQEQPSERGDLYMTST